MWVALTPGLCLWTLPPGLAPEVGLGNPNLGRVHLVFFVLFIEVIRIALAT